MTEVIIIGMDGLTAKLSSMAAKADGAAKDALMMGGKLIETACKSYCPVDTGRLRASIQTSEAGDTVEVAPHTNYAQYVEFGTYKMQAQPYMGPGFESSRAKALEFIKRKLEASIK